MFEWPWEKSERALSSRLERELENAEKRRLESIDRMSQGVGTLSNQVMQAVSDIQNKLNVSDKEMTNRMDSIASNFKVLHKAVGDSHVASGQVVRILEDRIKKLEEEKNTNDFFETSGSTIKGRCMEGLSSCFSKYHLLLIVNLLFVATAAVMSLLIMSNM